MSNPSITIPVDPETARAFDAAPPEKRRKMEALVGLWLRDLATDRVESLQEVLDEVGRKAQARGLTQEILDSILKGS